MSPSPEVVELAIELVNYVAGPTGPRAAAAEVTLESVCVDQLGRIEIALEIETRFDQVIADREVHEWCTVADVATSLARIGASA